MLLLILPITSINVSMRERIERFPYLLSMPRGIFVGAPSLNELIVYKITFTRERRLERSSYRRRDAHADFN